MPKKLVTPAIGRAARNDKSQPDFRVSPIERTRSAQTQYPDAPKGLPTSLSRLDEFGIQLLLDPHVTALEFRTSLPYSGREVPLEMFVADLDDGERAAFDLIDQRPFRSLDGEGLLLLALQSHELNLIEIDSAVIDSEPRASNTRHLWSFREHRVPPPLRASVDRVLAARQHLTVQSLAKIVGLRDPMPLLGALVSQGVLAIDPAKPLGPHSVVGRRCDRWPIAMGLNWFGKAGQ
ncbi:hypothetical protein [Bradyrhizobium sp. CER78]|uniref:hypothetical protein n=1 Tax=Bradyrhizobium sp. CER78 TaxID=3039162 RepID=UPI00244C9D5A|nr:hypothetical protein [Bradyrhizobium sp. CER78]MDH2386403.1 hypothetical protein [Bradyrhizobium sp. CER78]